MANVRKVELPYESVGAKRVVKFSGFSEQKRPESVEVHHDEDKKDFPSPTGFQIQNLCLLDKICGNNLEE